MRANILGMLAIAFMGLTACSDNEVEVEFPYYDEIENERVIAELNNVPAYVYDSFEGCVFICYSKYADEYYRVYNENPDNTATFSMEIRNDIWEHQIGVRRSDFDTYSLFLGISLHSKVYISASVTNNQNVKPVPNSNGEIALWSHLTSANKAYLKNIKPRN